MSETALNAAPVLDLEGILQTEVGNYVKKGYRVASQTPKTAQLVKPKKFSFWWALAWFLLLGVGLIVYLLYYGGKKDHQIYLTVDEGGRISRAS
ncbi:MAG TPA: hypothetical protein VNU19_02225 [Candidatus Acidoferrum sp.]|nr:hypothetical protein [Candidatus Acidoferrum sp.]